MPGVSVVRITGTIDDSFKRDAFSMLSGRVEPVVLDLDGVARITSYGVREWMYALRDLSAEQYFFVRCRPAIVAQFNTVHQFGGRGQILSFYCPYVCPSCDETFDVLVDVRKQRDLVLAMQAPAAECPACKSPAEFDDLESSYFSRIATADALVVPPAVEAVLDGGKAPDRPLQIQKAIEGELTVLWLSGSLDKSTRLKRHADGLEGKVLVVLDALESLPPDGFAKMRRLLEAGSPETYFARVPMELVRAGVATPATFAGAKVISAVLRTRCGACGSHVVIDVTEWRVTPSEGATRCPRCGAGSVAISWTPEDAAAVRKLPIVPAPHEIDAFVRSNGELAPDSSQTGSAPQRPRPAGPALPQSQLEPGARIGKYEVIRRIGMGGMAEVLLGRQLGVEGFEKKVVIKRILPHLAVQQSFVQMFLQEARIAARLLHGNIVQIYDLIREGDDYYAILEFVRGADLNVVLKLATQLDVQIPFELSCRIVSNVCAALDAAHTYTDDDGRPSPILHRDVSPHNVLLSTDGMVKLTDFGVAKAADSLHQTSTGALKGKVIYMAPEHILGQPTDHRIDIFAAGLILYTCIAQQNPFFRGTELLSLRAVLEDEIRTAPLVRSGAPPALIEVVMKALERDPAKRYASAAAFQDALERFLASYGRPASAVQLGAWLQEFLSRAREVGPSSMPDSATPSGLHGDVTATTPVRVGAGDRGARGAATDEDTSPIELTLEDS